MEGVPALRILVTAHLEPGAVQAAMADTGADGIQAHGRYAEEAAATGTAAGWFVLRPVSMATDPPRPDPGTVPGGQIPILDSAEGGGTGLAFDWGRTASLQRRFVLAGGLTAENVGAAIDTVHPWGVDASSGLEGERGVKDTGRVVAFIEEAKRL
jgi:phosphoribosylanthranilate isomerase